VFSVGADQESVTEPLPEIGAAPDELELLEVLLDVVPELEPEGAAVFAGNVTWMEKSGSDA
jgi:hypothetical protein